MCTSARYRCSWAYPVEFMPHVAPHFRGITMTVNLWLDRIMKVDEIRDLYRQHYAGEPLIRILDDAPWVSRIAGRHGVEIGGFTVAPGGKRVVVVATLDNLLKGAATQAMQNLNLAFGIDEFTSIPDGRGRMSRPVVAETRRDRRCAHPDSSWRAMT